MVKNIEVYKEGQYISLPYQFLIYMIVKLWLSSVRIKRHFPFVHQESFIIIRSLLSLDADSSMLPAVKTVTYYQQII